VLSVLRNLCLVLAVWAAASANADVVVPPAIAGNPWLKDLRKSMLKGQDLSDRELQILADAGEGLAAARYAKRLEARKDPAFLDDAAHYYSIAVYMDRDFALPRLIALVAAPAAEFSPARLRNLRAVLERATRDGNPVAVAGLAKLLLDGTPFGADVPCARELLLVAAEAGDADAAVDLALSYIQGAQGFPPDPQAAREALNLAASSPDPGVQAMALTLLKQIAGDTALAEDSKPTLEAVARPERVSALSDESVEEFPAHPEPSPFPPRPRPRPATLEGAAP
jgi:TPR repeat protein